MAADQRQRLLAALPRAVAENSFEGTTVEQIVRLAEVQRNAFYEQFADKQECFAVAYEIGQERLLGVLTFQCYTSLGPAERISAALEAGLGLLATEPDLARLIVLEAPAAGEAMSARHQAWLDRYSRMLRLAVVGSPDVAEPRPALEPAIAGAIVSRVRQLVLAGKTRELPGLHAELTQLVLSFFGSPDPLSIPGQREGVESAQPQSPERSSVLEPV
jgi:TetR/AcrR family transcriptional regulator